MRQGGGRGLDRGRGGGEGSFTPGFTLNVGFWSWWVSWWVLGTPASCARHSPSDPGSQDFSHPKFQLVPGQPCGEDGVLVQPLPLLPDLVLHDGGEPVGQTLWKALAAGGGAAE